MTGGMPVGGFDPASMAMMVGAQLLSSSMKSDANDAATNRKRQFSDAIQAYQTGKAKESQAATDLYLKSQTPDARGTELNQVTDLGKDSLTKSVGAAQAFDAPATAAATGGNYERASEAAADRVATRTKKAIEQLAAMRAPGEQKIRQGIRYGVTAGKVDSANKASAAAGAAGSSDINSVVPNGDDLMLADIVSGVGGGVGKAMNTPTLGDGSVIWTGAGEPGGADIADAALVGKNIRKPLSIAERLKSGLSLWGA